ncbi:MAG: LPS export ABC transporter periplasmic protein LptC [Gemmatimonadales bacterium]
MGSRTVGLPAAVLFALAAGGCKERGVRPTATTALRDTADQVMVKMSTRIHEQNVLRSHVEADTAYFYQVTQTVDFRGLRMRLYDAQGNQKSTLLARSGLYNSVSGSLDARGTVIVRSNQGEVLETEHLIYDRVGNSIRSDTVFVYTTPTERLTGTGFQSDIEVRNVRIEQPRGQQRGRGIELPGR